MPDKKKILFVLPALSGGGAEKVLLDMLRHFDHASYDVTLLLEYREGVYLGQVPPEVRLRTCFGRNTTLRQRLERMLGRLHLWRPYVATLRTLWVRHRAGGPYDTIVSFMEGAAVRIHAMLRHRAARHVSWIHIDMERKHWTRQYFGGDAEEARCYAMMNQLVFVSSDAMEAFARVFPQVNVPSEVLHNLIDAQEIRQMAGCHAPAVPWQRRDAAETVICMAGRLEQQKRYDRALAAAVLLKQRGLRFSLHVLGDGALRDTLEKQAAQSCLEGTVVFHGFVQPPYAAMAAADLFLNTSESEGYPLTLCEALCLGLPVVATDVAGAREILGHGGGMVVPEDETAIADALQQLMTDDALRRRAAQQAAACASAFDAASVMEHVYRLIS